MALKDNTDWIAITRLMQEEYDRKTVTWLASLGERVVKYAREDKSDAKHYTDRTGNLRNSIGYVVIQSGRVVEDGFGSSEPQTKARAIALDTARSLDGNKTYLVWVAGMGYAKYVEAKGFDVISGSGNWVEATAQTLMDEFKRYLMSKK